MCDEIAATTDYEGVMGTYEDFDANGDVIPQWAVGDIAPQQGVSASRAQQL